MKMNGLLREKYLIDMTESYEWFFINARYEYKLKVRSKVPMVYMLQQLPRFFHHVGFSYRMSHNDDVIKWKHFPRYWPFAQGIYRSSVDSPHKGQWRGALMFSLIYAWINASVNNCKAGDLRRHRAHCAVTVMRLLVCLVAGQRIASQHSVARDDFRSLGFLSLTGLWTFGADLHTQTK